MAKSKKIEGTVENWENGVLGCDEAHVSVSEELTMDVFNDLSESKPISIRMKDSMIDDLKFFAEREGLGYQTLIKNLLQRFIDGEYKRIVREHASDKAKAKRASAEAGLADEDEIDLQRSA